MIENLKKIKRSTEKMLLKAAQDKNQVLEHLWKSIDENRSQIIEQNNLDLSDLSSSVSSSFRDRLVLNDQRLDGIMDSIKKIIELDDPVGEEVNKQILPNNLELLQVRQPLGVIFMIFESRPNVAIEAFSLAFKSGNGIILKSGKESKNSTKIFYSLIEKAYRSVFDDEPAFWGIDSDRRDMVEPLLQQRKFIDIVIPRGGDGLIEFVATHSHIPVIKNDRGLCHTYIDDPCDLKMAVDIAVNAKTQRPGVCNAMETLLIHENIAPQILPLIEKEMSPHGVIWHGEPEIQKWITRQELAPPDWNKEYLDFELNCRVVSHLDEAIEHINKFGSKHSECIVTADENHANKFKKAVDAAAVYWNASTRFTDGFEFGLGGEIGISTQKLHVRGPVGLKELTSLKWVINGNGQIKS